MKRGRPPLDPADRTVPVTVGLPRKQFDAFCRQALKYGVSLPEVIRRYLPKPVNKNSQKSHS